MAQGRGGGAEENTAVYGGTVVLDIGGDIGALIAYLPDSFAGDEIDISVAGGSPFTHTGVHRRGAGDRWSQTAVYPELTTGDYQLWHPADGTPLGPVVHVEGGAVAELDLLSWQPSDAPAEGGGHQHGHGHGHSH